MDKNSVNDVIEKDIRPGLQSHGGDIELVDVKENKVYVQLQGACNGCPMATMTIKSGVEAALKQAFPELDEVVSL
jgi:Fe-S cluster biogenesis protein NfuA